MQGTCTDAPPRGTCWSAARGVSTPCRLQCPTRRAHQRHFARRRSTAQKVAHARGHHLVESNGSALNRTTAAPVATSPMLQRAIERAPVALDQVVARRMRYFLRRAPTPGEVAMMSVGMCQPSDFVAQSRLLVDGWSTAGRLSPGPRRCPWGCHAIGGDDSLHYSACWETPCGRIALRLRCCARLRIRSYSFLPHRFERTCCERRGGRPAFFIDTVRAQVRSPATRTGQCRALSATGG